MKRAAALRLLALFVCVQAASAAIAYDIEKPWKLWTLHARHAMLTVLLSLDYWFLMIIHVLLCITFWHCEAIAANTKTGTPPLPGAAFCKAGYRQSWPGESSSMSIKNIDSTHFWAQLPIVNNYLTSLLVFTLSFFNQQAYSKLTACMAAAGKASGALNSICFFCIAHVTDRAKARNLMRILHAYHHLAYMEFGAKIANPRSWEMLRDRNLLSEEECAYLRDAERVGSAKTIHVLSWAVQWATTEVKEGRLPAPAGNQIFSDLMLLRGGCGSLKSLTENPLPFGYFQAVNLLLYAWAVSVGLFFAGFLSVYGSVAYALVVYIFMNLRLVGIQLSEPFGYEARHLPVPEILMRGLTQHRELLSDKTLPLTPGGITPVESKAPPDFCAPFEAAYDQAFMTKFKGSEATKQMAFAQERFGFPGITEEDREKGALTARPIDIPQGGKRGEGLHWWERHNR